MPPSLPRLLLLDNFDSFTYNLAHYFIQAGAVLTVRRNNTPLKTLLRPAYDAVVLSPGPGSPENAGVLMDLVAAVAGRIPVIGICLGHQAIGLHYGAKVERAEKPVHGKIYPINTNQTDVYAGLPARFGVVRYHSLLLKDLPACLEVTAATDTGEVMSVRHGTLPVRGLQYHPEAVCTEHGLQLTANLLRLSLQGV